MKARDKFICISPILLLVVFLALTAGISPAMAWSAVVIGCVLVFGLVSYYGLMALFVLASLAFRAAKQ